MTKLYPVKMLRPRDEGGALGEEHGGGRRTGRGMKGVNNLGQYPER